ncbi:hypothetical protein DPMN_073385 [Dreissena polymorpha]|uniref:EGF-like domain-containing protein n=1 Tax=Dreissena polymorpha TaxID=45954 RepID=A0A9D4HDA0_DREPO|nr:hypothetical protein DPMN_073385 [Dreissena polymorpha]
MKECDIGSFGDECGHRCNCVDGKHCDTITGECSQPGCKDGWKGEACDQCNTKRFYGRL